MTVQGKRKGTEPAPQGASRYGNQGKSPPRRLRVVAGLLIVLILLAGLFVLHLRNQIRDTRTRELQVLGRAAEHVTAIMENSLRNLENLKDDLSKIDNFVARQPYLTPVEDSKALSAFRNYEATPEARIETRVSPDRIIATLTGLRPSVGQTWELTLTTRDAALHGELSSTPNTTSVVSDTGITLRNVLKKLAVVLDVQGVSDQTFLALHGLPVQAEFVSVSESGLRARILPPRLSYRILLSESPMWWDGLAKTVRLETGPRSELVLSPLATVEVQLAPWQQETLESLPIDPTDPWIGRPCGVWVVAEEAPSTLR